MKKLTQAVFDLPECPKWAKSAAIDSNGDGFWYEDTKRSLRVLDMSHDVSYTTQRAKFISSGFSTENWHQSAINRGE